MKVPVLIIAWKRPDKLKNVISALRKVKPDQLYIACDGPRSGNNNDIKLISETRKVFREEIDWNCTVKQRFQDKHHGFGAACPKPQINMLNIIIDDSLNYCSSAFFC